MKFSIIKLQRLWWTISAGIILAGLVAMGISTATIGSPLRPGLDFVGGTRFQVQLACAAAGNCDRPLEVSQIRDILDEQGLGGSTIQILAGNTLSIRSKALDVEQRTKLQSALQEKIGALDSKTLQIDTVGATIGKELFTSGLLALILSFFGIAAYLSFRFQFDFALFAIVALFHDVLITIGVFAILGLVAGIEVDSLFVVALLTISGFSVNDTVVIYDRIRENSDKFPELSIDEVVDVSVIQTLARSINTTLTALLPLVAIFLFGGETLKYFALALIIGFVMGAYSSIFIASSLLAWWRNRGFNKAVSE